MPTGQRFTGALFLYNYTMNGKQVVRFCYRKIINAASEKEWDKRVWESSYAEFLLQSQFYNQEKKYKTFAELLLHVPAAEKLHFLVSGAVTGYVQQLKGIIPDVLDNLGRHFLPFSGYRFEIINSDINNKAGHQVAVNFFSTPQVLYNTIGHYLLIADMAVKENEDGAQTHLLELKPFISICSYKQEQPCIP